MKKIDIILKYEKKKPQPLFNNRIALWFENLTLAIRCCSALKTNKNSFLKEVTMAEQRHVCPHGAVFSLLELLEHRDLGAWVLAKTRYAPQRLVPIPLILT